MWPHIFFNIYIYICGHIYIYIYIYLITTSILSCSVFFLCLVCGVAETSKPQI